MNRTFPVLGLAVPLWIVVPAFYLTWVLLGWALKRIVFAWLRRVTAKTETKLDDVLIGAADLPITIMIFVWGVAALVHYLGPSVLGQWPRAVTTACKSLTLVAMVLFVDRLLQHALHHAGKKFEVIRFSQAIGSVLIHALVLCIGGIMLLDNLGISITPIVASLGLGSLAVALAFQPTLENFISGFQILVDQPIRLGHYVRLETGEEGFVEKIGWRSTWIRQGVNNMIILPNKMVVNSRFVNYNYPTSEMIVTVPIGVHYGSDLEKVERVTLDVASEVLKRVPRSVPEFAPLVRFNKINASSVEFVAILRAKSFPDSALVVHEFVKSITARFARENIVMPYPIVALNTTQESAIFKPS